MEIDISELTSMTRLAIEAFSPRQQINILTRVGERVGAAAVRDAAEYPEPSGKPLPKIYPRVLKDGRTVLSKFKSQKQQVKVILLGKEGKIPYRRSGLLGRSITSRLLRVSNVSVTTEVGTNVPYASRVIGDNQSNYHKGTWMTLSNRMTANAAQLSAVAVSTYTVEVNKRLAR